MRDVFNMHQTEAGIDGMIELRDPKTEAALASFLGVQVKTIQQFDAESEAKFQFLSKLPGIWNSSRKAHYQSNDQSRGGGRTSTSASFKLGRYFASNAFGKAA